MGLTLKGGPREPPKQIKPFIGMVDGNCVGQCEAVKDSTGANTGWYKQIVSKVDSINDNNRLYPRTVYQAAIDRLKAAGFPYAGESPHPEFYRDVNGKGNFKTSVQNQAVKFRDAYIDQEGNVWAEFKPMGTLLGKDVQATIDDKMPIGFSNRMLAASIQREISGKQIDIASYIDLKVWDLVMNPAEPTAFDTPIQITDSVMKEIYDSIKEEPKNMKEFLDMTKEALKAWIDANATHADIEIAKKIFAMQDSVKTPEPAKEPPKEPKKDEGEPKEPAGDGCGSKAQTDAALAAQKENTIKVQTYILDEVGKLECNVDAKTAILKEALTVPTMDAAKAFIDSRKDFITKLVAPDVTQKIVDEKLKALGITAATDAKKVTTTVDVHVGEDQSWKPVVDNLMAEMDTQNKIKDPNFRVDEKLRKANLGILDNILKGFEREDPGTYKVLMNSLTDSAKSITDGKLTASNIFVDAAQSGVAQYGNTAVVSLAILRQAFQDMMALQLVMSEPFSGATYKMPVEFQTSDIWTLDDFGNIGEFDGIPTEGIATYLLEFAAQWYKRGIVISKESEVEMATGPFRYDVIARNVASLTSRFTRQTDKKIFEEMYSVSDEYLPVVVTNETPAAGDITTDPTMPSGSNVKYAIKMRCGNSSLTGVKKIPPIVRPRTNTYLDQTGRKQTTLTNGITVKVGTTTLIRGNWDYINGKIVDIPGAGTAQYAIDFENAVAYFVTGLFDPGASPATKPTFTQYSYATNVEFFDLTVSTALADFPARYYNLLLELMDTQVAYMGSAPRFVKPDFAIGSLTAMTYIKKAELFYSRALPEGTSLTQGSPYFGRRSNVDLGEINTPLPSGDQRILLGKINATRFGVGAPLTLEGPFQYINPTTGQLTSAKQWNATQQYVINTPLVIDGTGKQYNPPFRTIKYYNS